ncbi:hypothetical protein LSAT2_020491 [Lamellibrachia satsuma]|nr:hypothetical protein LSAT2_020491 [Lamellibrachia satsuma]
MSHLPGSSGNIDNDSPTTAVIHRPKLRRRNPTRRARWMVLWCVRDSRFCQRKRIHHSGKDRRSDCAGCDAHQSDSMLSCRIMVSVNGRPQLDSEYRKVVVGR